MRFIGITILFLIVFSSFTLALLGEEKQTLIINQMPGLTKAQADNYYCSIGGICNLLFLNATTIYSTTYNTSQFCLTGNCITDWNQVNVSVDLSAYQTIVNAGTNFTTLNNRINGVNTTANIQGLGYNTTSQLEKIFIKNNTNGHYIGLFDNVGIGTATPSSALQVIGSSNLSNTIINSNGINTSDIFFTPAGTTDQYGLVARGDNALAIKNMVAGHTFNLNYMAYDHDGTDIVIQNYVAKSNAGMTSYEALVTGWYPSISNSYVFYSINAGSGYATRPIRLITGPYTNQLVINTDGSVSMSGALTANSITGTHYGNFYGNNYGTQYGQVYTDYVTGTSYLSVGLDDIKLVEDEEGDYNSGLMILDAPQTNFAGLDAGDITAHGILNASDIFLPIHWKSETMGYRAVSNPITSAGDAYYFYGANLSKSILNYIISNGIVSTNAIVNTTIKVYLDCFGTQAPSGNDVVRFQTRAGAITENNGGDYPLSAVYVDVNLSQMGYTADKKMSLNIGNLTNMNPNDYFSVLAYRYSNQAQDTFAGDLFCSYVMRYEYQTEKP